jgi:hypothetical protein
MRCKWCESTQELVSPYVTGYFGVFKIATVSLRFLDDLGEDLTFGEVFACVDLRSRVGCPAPWKIQRAPPGSGGPRFGSTENGRSITASTENKGEKPVPGKIYTWGRIELSSTQAPEP